MSSASSFEVFLTEEAAATVGDDSMVAGRLEYYDSGVWVTRESGREFFPYERIVRITERTTEDETEAESTAETEREAGSDAHAADEASGVGERRDAASGATESVDGHDEQ